MFDCLERGGSREGKIRGAASTESSPRENTTLNQEPGLRYNPTEAYYSQLGVRSTAGKGVRQETVGTRHVLIVWNNDLFVKGDHQIN